MLPGQGVRRPISVLSPEFVPAGLKKPLSEKAEDARSSLEGLWEEILSDREDLPRVSVRMDRFFSGSRSFPSADGPVSLPFTDQIFLQSKGHLSDSKASSENSRSKSEKKEEDSPKAGDSGDSGGKGPSGDPSALGEPSYDYERMFDLSRKILTRPQARKFLKEAFQEELEVSPEVQKEYALPEKIKEMSESQFMALLQYNPQHWHLLEQYLKEMSKMDEESPRAQEARTEWRKTFRELIRDEKLKEKLKKLNDPTEPLVLEWPNGTPGYTNVQLYANHRTYQNGQWTPAADLKKVVIDFIQGAQSKIIMNFYDFDRMEVADELVKKSEEGVDVTVGIDQGVIEERPEVKAVFERLKSQKKIRVHAVKSVGLNHQKIIVRDWDNPKKAKTLFSSGNLTQSCIGPEGDLVDVKPTPRISVPNANHIITLDGYLAALTAADNLIKTLDPDYQLEGRQYPLGGAFKIFGPSKSKNAQAPYLILAFSPKGGLGDINRDITRRLILETRGPIRMLQFAFSSESIGEALIERARLETSEGNSFDFKSVGDGPFAVRPWSVFLRLIGYELKEEKDFKEYVKSKENPLLKILGKEAYESLVRNIRIAPPVYREHTFKTEEGALKVNAKLHHKAMVSGDFVIAGTSFNFSENANTNNEQFLLFMDPDLAAGMTTVFDGLFMESKLSVEEEISRRNEFLSQGGKDDDWKDSESRSAEKQAGRPRK